MLKSLYDYFISNKVVILCPYSDNKAEMGITLIPFVKNQPLLNGQTTAYFYKNYSYKFPITNLKISEELLNNKEVQLR